MVHCYHLILQTYSAIQEEPVSEHRGRGEGEAAGGRDEADHGRALQADQPSTYNPHPPPPPPESVPSCIR